VLRDCRLVVVDAEFCKKKHHNRFFGLHGRRCVLLLKGGTRHCVAHELKDVSGSRKLLCNSRFLFSGVILLLRAKKRRGAPFAYLPFVSMLVHIAPLQI